MKRVLVLNGSFCEVTIIEKLKSRGYYVITTGNAPDLIGHKLADEYIPADYSDKEAILKLVKDNSLDGIVSCANDFGVITAAYVSEKMGWNAHDTYDNAVLLHHKDLFKKYCYDNNIPSPHSIIFNNVVEAEKYCMNCIYPVIVKANDLTGGKGIKRANNFEEAKYAIYNAYKMSRDKHILVEPYIEGTQHSFCTFLVNKKVAFYSSCKSYSFSNPYLIQAETFPSCDIDEKISCKLISIIEKMARDLNLADGILNLQLILKDEDIYIIETMRRCFGNDALSLFSLESGYDWEDAYINASLGLDCSGKKSIPRKKYCGHYGIMPYKNGVLRSCVIDNEIQNHIFKQIRMIRDGETIENCMNERIAYLYYEYDSIKTMNEDILTYSDQINVVID